MLAEARSAGRYVDMTCGHGVKSLLLMVDGQVVGCPAKSRTMLSRLNALEINGVEPMDDGKDVE